MTAHTGVPPAALCIMDQALHALSPAPFGCIEALNIGDVGPAPPGRAARGGDPPPGAVFTEPGSQLAPWEMLQASWLPKQGQNKWQHNAG